MPGVMEKLMGGLSSLGGGQGSGNTQDLIRAMMMQRMFSAGEKEPQEYVGNLMSFLALNGGLGERKPPQKIDPNTGGPPQVSPQVPSLTGQEFPVNDMRAFTAGNSVDPASMDKDLAMRKLLESGVL